VVRHRRFRFDGGVVAGDDVSLVRVRLDGVDQVAQPASKRRQRR
jgi:hypothetical protein